VWHIAQLNSHSTLNRVITLKPLRAKHPIIRPFLRDSDVEIGHDRATLYDPHGRSLQGAPHVPR